MKNIIFLLIFWLTLQSTYSQKKVAIYWDASYSMKDREIDRDLKYLDNYFKKYENANVTLVVFSNEIILEQNYSVTNSNWNGLKMELQNTIYDGATAYSDLFKEGFDEYFLFTDGVENLDKLKPPTDKPIHLVSTSPDSNSTNLKLLADLSQGSYVYLSNEPAVKEKTEIIETGEETGFISGVIKGEEGNLSNVSIINKNTNRGTASNLNGSYRIKADEGDLLVFTYLGKKSVNIRVSKAEIVNITMEQIDESLDEILVTTDVETEELVNVGNKRVDKKRIGYAVESITADDISEINTDLEMAVAGQFSNFELKGDQNITQFLSRGKNMTILLDQTGLVVVDGVPLESDPVFSGINPSGSGTKSVLASMGLLNVDNIAEITLLKGLAATNKYGTLGRNGVLLITTKSSLPGEVTKRKEIPLGTTDTYSGNAQLISELPDTPYINALKSSTNIDDAFFTYLEQRELYGHQATYYLDAFDYFKGWNNPVLSKRILSNVYEVSFDNVNVLRALSYKQQSSGDYKGALETLKRVAKLNPKQSQTYRDLAIANSYAGKYQDAIKIYDNIDKNINVSNCNFAGIQRTVINDAKNLITQHKNELNISGINQSYLRPIKYKARIIFEWNSLDSEFDLNIINPQKRFFTWSHTQAENSLRIQQQKQQGYGLEEFYLTAADIGEWTFNMKYYGGISKKDGPTYIKITIYENFGSPNQTKDIKVVRLEELNVEQTVAKFVVN